jgi:hypothetical protein
MPDMCHAQTSHWAGDAQAAIAYTSRAVSRRQLLSAISTSGRFESRRPPSGALEALEMGLRLSRESPDVHLACQQGSSALSPATLRRVEAAAAARRIQPHAYGSLVLVASSAQLGRNEGAARLAGLRPPGGSAKIASWYLTATPPRPRVRRWPMVCARRAFWAATAKASASKDGDGNGQAGRTAADRISRSSSAGAGPRLRRTDMTEHASSARS